MRRTAARASRPLPNLRMRKRSPPHPTDAELRILQVLWKRGPGTVREIQEELDWDRPTGYTTVLKLLQIMHDKGLVKRDETHRSHVYRATLGEEETQRQLAAEVLERAFGGSAAKLVMRALSVKRASREELAEIRELLDAMERERRP